MRRVLVTATDSPLGKRLAAHLGQRPDMKLVERPETWEHGPLVDLLASADIDTIVHVGLVGQGRPIGPAGSDTAGLSGAFQNTDARVIRTMRLAAAVGRGNGPVRTFVVASSAAVYPSTSRAPLMHREHETLTSGPNSEAAALLEAEDYVRDVALANPHISVAILRLADLVGSGASTPLSALLRRPVVPFVPGFDPSVQFLHIDDAVSALEHAADHGLAGLFNVAGTGTIRWTRAIRAARRWPWPVTPASLGSLSQVLCHGRCLDTNALLSTGFQPAHSSEQCVRVELASQPEKVQREKVQPEKVQPEKVRAARVAAEKFQPGLDILQTFRHQV